MRMSRKIVNYGLNIDPLANLSIPERAVKIGIAMAENGNFGYEMSSLTDNGKYDQLAAKITNGTPILEAIKNTTASEGANYFYCKSFVFACYRLAGANLSTCSPDASAMTTAKFTSGQYYQEFYNTWNHPENISPFLQAGDIISNNRHVAMYIGIIDGTHKVVECTNNPFNKVVINDYYFNWNQNTAQTEIYGRWIDRIRYTG